MFYLMSRLVSRPPLGGPDWSEPGRGRGLPGSGGCGVINWDDWLVVQSASQPVRDRNILISPPGQSSQLPDIIASLSWLGARSVPCPPSIPDTFYLFLIQMKFKMSKKDILVDV